MQQPETLVYWLPAAIAGAAALIIAVVVIWFYQRRWNRLAQDRQAMLNEIAALEKDKLHLRCQDDGAGQGKAPAPAEELPGAADAELPDAVASTSASRFPLLSKLDAQYARAARADAPRPTLQQLAEHLRRHAAARCGVYAPLSLYGSFLGAMAVSELLLIRAEDGPPAAVPNAIAQTLGQELKLVVAQPGWRASSDLLGQCSAATKRYEETPFLRLLYEAGWRKEVILCAIQDFMAALPERYLAELLPLLELRTPLHGGANAGAPKRRNLHLADSAWPNDPMRLENGRLLWPEGLWLLGLLNAGDPSPSPRLREIAMEFCVPAPVDKAFLVPWTQSLPIEAAHLRALFDHAAELYRLPSQMRGRYDALEEYLAAQMQLSFGAKSAERLERFAAVCLACGMSSREAVDSYLWHHALRRLDTLEPAALRHLLPGLREFLGKTFEKRSIQMTMGLVETLA